MNIAQIMGFEPLEGDVGLEIEVEGALPEIRGDKYWKTVPDGSLRNGLEYIYRRPLPVSKVEDSILSLNKSLKEVRAKVEFSFRTSVHVHVNCLEMEYQHVLNYIYIYLLLESLLVEYCGEGRKCNRFCLRLEDADGSIELLTPLFRSTGTKTALRSVANDQLRYASINVQALSKFGSLEFRAMRGTLDAKVLVPWVETLVHLRQYATSFKDTKEIFNHIEAIGFREFFVQAIGKHYKLFDKKDAEYIIARGQSLSIEIPFIPKNIQIKLTDKNKEDLYQYQGEVYTLGYLHGFFGGGEFPPEVFRVGDKKAAGRAYEAFFADEEYDEEEVDDD